MENIDNITVYDDPFALADENWDGMENLTEDQRLYVQHVNDFEEWKFLLVNYTQVIVFSGCDGFVCGKFETIDEFMENLMESYEEE